MATMQIAAKKIVRLLQPDQPPDVRRAAAIVLGEVGARDAALAAARCDRLDVADPALRLAAIEAVGKLGIGRALPALLERVKTGGEGAEAAAHAAAKLGAKGTRALQELMPRVAPGLRRYI